MFEFIGQNWLWIIIALLFVGMHAFGGGWGMGHRRRADSSGDKTGREAKKGCH